MAGKMTLIADRYEPTGVSASGGMGDIHRCIDNHLDREVVIKVLKPGHGVERLIDEQKALVKLRSKHVVQLLDVLVLVETKAQEICLVLEFIDGKDLAERQFLPDEEYLRTLWQIASGLTDIHAAEVIHRDIKPNNMRLDREGVVKILDFGLAREVGKDDKTRSIIGTLGYMAPELRGDETISFSPAVDVYSFGVSALTLLDRDLPEAIARQWPKSLSDGAIAAHVPELQHEIADVIEACLAHDHTQRPKMCEVRDVLAQFLVRDRHRARMIMGNTVYELHSGNRNVKLKSAIGMLHVHYDGLGFRVRDINGEVFVNNGPALKGQEMPPACVITFGSPERTSRAFLTFDVSNPEVLA